VPYREHGVRSQILPSVGRQKTDRTLQFVTRQTEQGRDSRVLQGLDGQTASSHGSRQPNSDPSAESAFCIEEEPTARVASFTVGHF
jgi:hypothetical protein